MTRPCSCRLAKGFLIGLELAELETDWVGSSDWDN